MNKKALLKVVISSVLLFITLNNVDLEQLVLNFRQFELIYIPLIVGFLLLNYVISSVRWKKLLIFENSQKASLSYLMNLYFVGAFFNNFMPTSIGGDVYKVYKLGNKIGSKANAFSATFMERFTGMVALVLISYFGIVKTWSIWLSFLPQEIAQSNLLLTMFKLMIFLGFWVGAVAAFVFLKILAKKSKKLKKLYESIMVYKKEKEVMFWAFLTSFVVQLISIFTQFFIFKGLNVDMNIWYALAVFPVITLASFFIPSLNGIGVQDAMYNQIFTAGGITTSTIALSASIIYHLFRLFVSLIGGFIYAFNKNT